MSQRPNSSTTAQFEWDADERWLAAQEGIDASSTSGRVVTYQSSHDPWLTSSYFVETELGVVLFDTQLFPASALELRDRICERTDAPLHCVVITHAHPDHYWGNAIMREHTPGVPIVTSAGVDRELRANAEAHLDGTPSSWHDLTADSIVFPTIVFDGSATLTFDDLTIELFECGPAECESQVVGWIPEHELLIAGDLVQNRLTYAVQDHWAGSWRRLLDDLRALRPRHVLTGHLGAAGPQILDESVAWFDAFLDEIGRELSPTHNPEQFGLLDERARAGVVAAMQSRFPDWWDSIMYDSTETILEWGLRVATASPNDVVSLPHRSVPARLATGKRPTPTLRDRRPGHEFQR